MGRSRRRSNVYHWTVTGSVSAFAEEEPLRAWYGPAGLRPRIALVFGCFLCCLLSLPARAELTDEVFYHFMPIAWRDSDLDAARFGDFDGMTASLDYLENLGITAVWMNPVFPSPAYHGYQHGPADQFNAGFGLESEWIAFLEEAHLRGIKVYVDFVAYGISHDSVWFQDAFGNPASAYDDWLAFNDAGNTSYLGATYPTWNGDTVGFIHWDLRNPQVQALVTEWAVRLLDPDEDGDFSDGVDGFRLDHVWVQYPNGPDGWGYNLDDFWTPWSAALRAVNPEVEIFAEQADWGSYGGEFLGVFDGAFTKPFEFGARDALANEYAAPLYTHVSATLAARAGADSTDTFLATIGNHDVDRLATNIGDNFAKGRVAACVLLTQPFPPIIYYGDEIGMRGAKNFSYSGDAVDIPFREPFKWNAVAGPPMSNYYLLNTPAYLGSVSQDNDGRSVEEQEGVPGSLLETYRELIAARRGSSALTEGAYYPVSNSSSQVWAFVRASQTQQVLVVANLANGSRTAALDLSEFTVPGGATTPVDLISGATLGDLTSGNQGAYSVTLGAYQFHILELDLISPAPPINLVDGLDIPQDFAGAPTVLTQNAPAPDDNVLELDQLFARSTVDSLFIGVTGNLGVGGGLALLFDTGPGGQNVLNMSGTFPPPSGPELLTGLRLDAGFSPDWLVYINRFGSDFYVDQFHLESGGASKVYRGQGNIGSGSGIILGGDNPHGSQFAFDNSNLAGVTGTETSGAATATSGFEVYFAHDDLELPVGGESFIGLAAFLLLPDGNVVNQWLPGAGPGASILGIAPDMTSIPGDQFAVTPLYPGSTSVPVGSLQSVHLWLTGPNPFQDETELAFWLPEAGDVGVMVFDAAGRLIRLLTEETYTRGIHRVRWDGRDERGGEVPTGVYFGRLDQDRRVDRVRILRIR